MINWLSKEEDSFRIFLSYIRRPWASRNKKAFFFFTLLPTNSIEKISKFPNQEAKRLSESPPFQLHLFSFRDNFTFRK